jgi:type IV secretory pathway TraG/TraD family ATPase VirD4
MDLHFYNFGLDEVYNLGYMDEFTTWLDETCKFGWMNVIRTLLLEAYF